MYQLTRGVLALMIGFIFSIFIGLILVPLLRKIKVNQSLSIYLSKAHREKEGTPTMGGLIFIIPTIVSIVVLLVLHKINFSANLFIVMFVFLSYALLGFLDDFLIIKRHNNKGLTPMQKLIGQILIAVVFYVIYMKSGVKPEIELYTLGIKIHLGWFYGLFILFMLVASSNAVNITDGLDGLAGGLSLIVFLTFALISGNARGISGSSDISVFCFVLVGCLLGFLAFNSRPAKVFMGDTGSLALGATLASIAIITKHELTFVVVMGVFIFETLTCLIQILSVKYFHKRVFLMAPYHHHLEKLGWNERDIVIAFWCVGLFLSFAAILFGVWY